MAVRKQNLLLNYAGLDYVCGDAVLVLSAESAEGSGWCDLRSFRRHGEDHSRQDWERSAIHVFLGANDPVVYAGMVTGLGIWGSWWDFAAHPAAGVVICPGAGLIVLRRSFLLVRTLPVILP